MMFSFIFRISLYVVGFDDKFDVRCVFPIGSCIFFSVPLEFLMQFIVVCSVMVSQGSSES
ncbi:hypothetical protein HanXRQr2_Chr16g0726741 [Helianthus annuus]|uniref:Uncharacterized protein n=1 Tax=Helianthus annuus TaxID=4232 RepID=A0A9K3GW91_HELAN|nr:hypothetical protein HanXRQr2_Chr16g0726741 [Helianthus annuus]